MSRLYGTTAINRSEPTLQSKEERLLTKKIGDPIKWKPWKRLMAVGICYSAFEVWALLTQSRQFAQTVLSIGTFLYLMALVKVTLEERSERKWRERLGISTKQ